MKNIEIGDMFWAVSDSYAVECKLVKITGFWIFKKYHGIYAYPNMYNGELCSTQVRIEKYYAWECYIDEDGFWPDWCQFKKDGEWEYPEHI